MNRKARLLAHGALIGAMYVALCHLQNLIFPDSASFFIQFRAAEALCVLAFFTTAAIPGLAVGCLLINITSSAVLPLDFLVGSLATLSAAQGMHLTRRWTLWGYPLPGMLMPALTNAVLVGWELSVYVGGGFWFNAGCVAIGEIAVLMTLGLAMYGAVKARKLDRRLFGLN